MHTIASLLDVARGSVARHLTPLIVAVLITAPFAIYSNNYQHAYHLDDAYTLVSNPSIRSLSAIPSYFVDPGTYTSVRSQADYRPILQVSYALNYRLGGYDTRWWHFTQILLHTIVTLGLFALARRILFYLGEPHPERIACIAALIFAVHPAASGVVNYFNARSSLLTAAFLLPTLLMYMKPVDPTSYARPQWLVAALYALALFTKVEAVGMLGALFAFDLWQRGRENPSGGFRRSLVATIDGRTLRRLAPALAVTVVYFVIRMQVMAPFPFADSRHAADVGAYEYFLTQLTTWWYYVLRWVAPVNLVADHLAYPVFRSWRDPQVLLAAAGWACVAAALVVAWRRAPYLAFLALASLALISPTSSVAPLAEMVNEHRPYLPLGIASLLLVIPVGRWVARLPRQEITVANRSLAGGLAVALFALASMTYRRNDAFSTTERFWLDVLQKAPSARAHLNYGVSRMAANDMADAMRHFHASLELAPRWFYTHINLGVAYQKLGQVDSARIFYDRAVAYDQYSGSALTWRGEFHLAMREFDAARDDFLASSKISLDRYRNAKGLGAAYAALGDHARSVEQAGWMLSIDAAAATEDAQARFMEHGVALLYQANDPAAAADAFQKVLQLNPTHYGATYQLAKALAQSGRATEAREYWQRVLRMSVAHRDSTSERIARTMLR
jgi:tetratricopeptide (TPR) repeat protein